MKKHLSPAMLPNGALLISCSSHEERCEGLARRKGIWQPGSVVLFHYDDENRKREERHEFLTKAFSTGSRRPVDLPFVERNAAASFHANMQVLDAAIRDTGSGSIVLDISVLTKRHLLMILHWLDDRDLWDRLWIVYCEPGDYVVTEYVPLSFGIANIDQIPGFSASPDMSRALRLAIFLGYEGDRALATYESIQPMETRLVIPDPPYRPEWNGRTEALNRDLIKLVGEGSIVRVDAVDPESSLAGLRECFGPEALRTVYSKVVCPLGTKPQAVGIYMYVRACTDPPALVYASPLRHNHAFYSRGIGESWILKEPL
ncbi:MAG: hypothetical protein WC712_01885 [Candidatus Brocadiia bacterium]